MPYNPGLDPRPFNQLSPEEQAIRSGRTLNFGPAQNYTPPDNTQITPTQDSGFDFQAMIKQLKQAQAFGYQKQQGAEQQQFERGTAALPSDLAGAQLSPSQIQGFRRGEVSAIEPTVGGARDLVSQATKAIGEYQQSQAENQQKVKDTLELAAQGGSQAIEGLLKSNPEIFKLAGLEPNSFLAGIKAKEQAKTKQQDFENSLKSTQERRLGLTGGTSVGGATPKSLTTGQRNEVGDIDALLGQVNQLIGSPIIGAVGFFRGPTESAIRKIFGKGNNADADVRALIGNIKGTVAKLRGGTSFTVNEEKLLNSYVPSIGESAESVLDKARGLKAFLESKKAAITGQQQNVQETKVVNGTTYIKQSDGLWHKQ